MEKWIFNSTIAVLLTVSLVNFFVALYLYSQTNSLRQQMVSIKQEQNEEQSLKNQKDSASHVLPPPPSVKSYTISLYADHTEPNGYTINSGDQIKVVVENKDQREREILFEGLNINIGIIKPGEKKEFFTTIPSVSTSTYFNWLDLQDNNEKIGLFSVQGG